MIFDVRSAGIRVNHSVRKKFPFFIFIFFVLFFKEITFWKIVQNHFKIEVGRILLDFRLNRSPRKEKYISRLDSFIDVEAISPTTAEKIPSIF